MGFFSQSFIHDCECSFHIVECLKSYCKSCSFQSLQKKVVAGLPQSGKNIWKMKYFPGQGKVWEFCGWPGKGQGSRRVKIGPVTKINEIWLYRMCMSSVTENDSF